MLLGETVAALIDTPSNMIAPHRDQPASGNASQSGMDAHVNLARFYRSRE
jgi:hypothetical protein